MRKRIFASVCASVYASLYASACASVCVNVGAPVCASECARMSSFYAVTRNVPAIKTEEREGRGRREERGRVSDMRYFFCQINTAANRAQR